MMKNILGHAFYQLVVVFTLLFAGKNSMPDKTSVVSKLIFQMIICYQFFKNISSLRLLIYLKLAGERVWRGAVWEIVGKE